MAVEVGNVKIVKELLDSGANVNARMKVSKGMVPKIDKIITIIK